MGKGGERARKKLRKNRKGRVHEERNKKQTKKEGRNKQLNNEQINKKVK